MTDYRPCNKCNTNRHIKKDYYANKKICKICCREYSRNYYHSTKHLKNKIIYTIPYNGMMKQHVEAVQLPSYKDLRTKRYLFCI